eukprot:Opistho-2@931
MSSELFEALEVDFTSIYGAVGRKVNSEIGTLNGEQRKAMVRNLERDLKEADDLIQQMENELRMQPQPYRQKLQTRVRNYQSDLTKLKKDLRKAANPAVSARDELLGGDDDEGDIENGAAGSRARLLANDARLGRTTERIQNAQRVANESEQIGAAALGDLAHQHETLRRGVTRLQDADANLSKSRRILHAMQWRIVTNKLIMCLVILILAGILGVVVWRKFIA